jgi:hypothetical protein
MRKILGSACICLAVLACHAAAAPQNLRPAKKDGGNEAWEQLRIPKYGICIEYPSDEWAVLGGTSGDGVSLVRKGETTRWPALTGMGFGGWSVQTRAHVPRPGKFAGGPPLTLEEDLKSLLKAGEEAYHAQGTRILSEKESYTEGLPTLTAVVEFKEGKTGTLLYYREVLMHTTDNRIAYHVDLTCRRESLPTLLPIFQRVVATFRANCKG